MAAGSKIAEGRDGWTEGYEGRATPLNCIAPRRPHPPALTLNQDQVRPFTLHCPRPTPVQLWHHH